MTPPKTVHTPAPPRPSAADPGSTWRWTATLLVGVNGFYMLLVAFGNITDPASNQAFVAHVMAMDTTNFGQPPGTGLDPRVMWRAVTRPWLQNTAYIAIIVWESASAAVLATAVIAWLTGRRDSYQRARQLSTAGLLMIVVLFAGGFICVGGEWFAMYRSTTWNGLEPAFRNTVLAVLSLIVVQLPTNATPTRAAPVLADRDDHARGRPLEADPRGNRGNNTVCVDGSSLRGGGGR